MRLNHKRSLLLFLAVVVAIAAPVQFAAAADQAIVTGTKERGPVEQDWQFSLGSFLVTSKTKLTVNGDTVSGNEVDWENAFDLKDKSQFRLDAFWRFAERHKVRMMWFQNNRSGSRTITREIDFQDQIYPVNTEVNASLDEQIIELAYEYAFYKTDTLEFSGSAGIHALKFDAGLSATISTPGGPSTGTQVSSDASVTGPLPVIGGRVLWDMGNNFYLDGMAQFFYISFDNFDGSITDVTLKATWMPWRNFGIGLGYNNFATRVDVSKNNFDGRIKFTYGGPMLFVTAGF